MKQPNEVLCIGFTTVDQVISGIDAGKLADTPVYPAKDCSFSVGGDAANEAASMARMGIRTGLCTKLGDDFLAGIVLDFCEKSGVDTSRIIRDGSTKTTMGIALIGDNDSRRIIPVAKGRSTECLTAADIKTEWFEGLKAISFASLFVVSRMTPPVLKDLFAAAKKAGCLVCCDVKMTGSEKIEDIQEILPYVDYIFPNFAEARVLTGETDPIAVANRFLDFGAGCVVLKLGLPGAVIITKKDTVWIPSYPAKSVDSTGAGDNFAAGFIAGLVRGKEPVECGKMACAASSLCVRHYGTVGEDLTMEQLEGVIRDGEPNWADMAAQVPGAWEKEQTDSLL